MVRECKVNLVKMSLVFLLFLIIMLFVSGCQKGNESIVILNKPSATAYGLDNKCGNDICANNELCVKEKCICDAKSIKCGEKCLSRGECCTDNDCVLDFSCINNACTDLCEDKTCADGKACDKKSGECTCQITHKWCELQKICIPKDGCCSDSDCRIDEVCIKIKYAAQMCFFENDKKSCKSIVLGKNRLSFGNESSNLLATEISEKMAVFELDLFLHDDSRPVNEPAYSLNASIDDSTDASFNLSIGSSVKIDDDLTIFLESIKVIGGKCEADNPKFYNN